MRFGRDSSIYWGRMSGGGIHRGYNNYVCTGDFQIAKIE